MRPSLVDIYTRRLHFKMSVCACREHSSFCGGQDALVIKLAHKKVKKGTVQYFVANGLMPGHGKALCRACVDHVERRISTKEDASTDFDRLVKRVKSGEFTTPQLEKLSEAIGEVISGDIYRDAVNIKDLYKNGELHDKLDIQMYLDGRNEVLLSFLRGCAGGIESIENCKKRLCLAASLDSVYKARNLNFISPLSFAQNIISYHIAGSKTVIKLNASQRPCGSYSTIQRWLQQKSADPCGPPGNADVITFFDNNQVVSRNWRVNYNYKSSASVITTCVHIHPRFPEVLQQTTGYSPRLWLHSGNQQHTTHLIKSAIDGGESDYASIRYHYLELRLQKVKGEKVLGGVDAVASRSKEFIGPQLPGEDLYDWVPHQHPETPPAFKVGEPCMCNPCSYESVTKVLKHICNDCDVGKSREWTCIGCDGLPYVLASRLIEKDDSLKDVLLIPGHGHMEINALKGCFKLLWDVGLEDVAKMLGYRSPRALVCCKGCTDHHKAWMLMCIFFFGTMDEVLSTYIDSATASNSVCTVDGLYNYIGNCNSKNVRFLCDVLFNYVLAIFVFRCGVRRNNAGYIMAGKSKFMQLFYGLHQTHYQQVIFYDMKTRVLAPPAVREFINKTESFSQSGHPSKGEGGDFVLEAVNGKTKRWLPPGIPTEQHWKQVCRNLDTLNKIRQNTFQECSIHTDDAVMYQRDLRTEILEWRINLRAKEYISFDEQKKAVFTYEAQTCVLKVAETGEGSLDDMLDELNSSKIMYAYCKVMDPNTNLPKYVLINWQGEAAPESMKFKCANHLRDIKFFFRGIHVTVNARTEGDIDEQEILQKVAKSSGSQYSIHKEKAKPQEEIAPVGSVYAKTQVAKDINIKVRDQFWAKTETEEQKRIAEDRRQQMTREKSLDEERKAREAKEAVARDKQTQERARVAHQQKVAERRASQSDEREQKEKWETEQQAAFKEDEERRHDTDRARKERVAEATSLTTKTTSNARSFFQRKASESEDQPPASRPPPPSRKLKHGFGAVDQQDEPARKQPIQLPERQPSPPPNQLEREPSPPPRQPSPPRRDPSPPRRQPSPPRREPSPPPREPSPPPVQQPTTKNLLAASLPPRQPDSDEEQDDDWGEDEVAQDIPAVQASHIPEPEHDDPVQEEPVVQSPGSDQGLCVRALYDYQAADESEITFDPEDLITNVEKIDEGWWIGSAPDGSRGMFPANFVDPI